MDDIIEIYDSDSNDCAVTGYSKEVKRRKLDHDSDSESYTDSNTNTSSSGPILVEDSESESECECDTWDKDCEICSIVSEAGPFHGFHLMPTCMNDPELNPPKKHIADVPLLRSDINSETFLNEFRTCFNNRQKLNKNNVELITSPFRVGVVKDFLKDASYFQHLRQEFDEVEWHKRSLDLYEFFQSKDLKHIEDLKYIKSTYEFLQKEVMPWVARLTGYPLTHISATCSLYSDTDYLLVHDDRQDDRMVAYVLYFTGKEDWCSKYGGALQLLSKDGNGEPLEPVRDVLPSNNQFVFFPVTNDSFHQVTEVTCKNDCRMSINGWFHVASPPVYDMPVYRPPEDGLYGNRTYTQQSMDIDLDTWISPVYLDPPAVREIQLQMEEDSEISLRRYFKEEPFREVLECLKYEGVKWKRVGPPNRRLYDVLLSENLPHALDRFLKLFQSSSMFSLLSKYTELEFRTDRASMRYEFQKWTPGSYSLLSDYDWQKKELDVIIYLGCSRNNPVVGGQTQYITTDEQIQSALITLEPQENNLNVVFRDTARITRYVSMQSRCKCFYLLVCSYSE